MIYEDETVSQLINKLPQRSDSYRFADDIATAHHVLLDSSKLVAHKETELRKWLSRNQPCIFGRAGSLGKAGLNIDICWITEEEIAFGDTYLEQKIQRVRQSWKDKAEFGFSSGFLIFFNGEKLARAIPSPELVQVCLALSRLYLVEQGTIEPDTIYTEAVPLRMDGQLSLFKAGCNIFYTGADRTRNHDRRVPGGLLFSMNSPGHFANSLFLRGKYETLEDAVQRVQDLAFRSIGNGGIGHTDVPSTSWHRRTGNRPAGGCPIKHNPPYIPDDVDTRRYAALYHTDVLVPGEITSDPTDYARSRATAEVWSYLIIDYMTLEQFLPDHPNYGLFRGHPVNPTEKYANPWQPRRAKNEELFGD